jgi:hypothetical protein
MDLINLARLKAEAYIQTPISYSIPAAAIPLSAFPHISLVISGGHLHFLSARGCRRPQIDHDRPPCRSQNLCIPVMISRRHARTTVCNFAKMHTFRKHARSIDSISHPRENMTWLLEALAMHIKQEVTGST